jgi:carboxylate-amine ligase
MLKIWWDSGTSFFNTEFRICDVHMTEETICIAALFRAILLKFTNSDPNLNFIIYQRALINENKWRASRYGIGGHLIDFERKKSIPVC